ncbi:hypothetical protein O6H91_16G046800 [Diphasiastrum complanatum]|uniref:Uncharacterized protein n=2 Tax=Diphasiastrum complanatum TaxID=34168 RepID=A0ACC2BBZ7_DIPCM|nr:hypothetical protein O6H91_16G026700 [Diphasiastrum complanatum]KAJ7527285.1 hypothetical protein O6H91_16G046800 [Diphasiastrum complanatum]
MKSKLELEDEDGNRISVINTKSRMTGTNMQTSNKVKVNTNRRRSEIVTDCEGDDDRYEVVHVNDVEDSESNRHTNVFHSYIRIASTINVEEWLQILENYFW